MSNSFLDKYNLAAQVFQFEAESQAWKDFRRTGITGTELAVLYGLNNYTDVHDLIKDKQGKAPVFEMNYYARTGQVLEPTNIMLARKVYGLDAIAAQDSQDKVILLKHNESSLMCSLDGVIRIDGEVFPLECKSTTYNSFHNTWKKTIPMSYLIQLAVQAICLDSDTGYIGVIVHQPPEGINYYSEISFPIQIQEYHLYKFTGLKKFKENFLEETDRFMKALTKKSPSFVINTTSKNKILKVSKALDSEELYV